MLHGMNARASLRTLATIIAFASLLAVPQGASAALFSGFGYPYYNWDVSASGAGVAPAETTVFNNAPTLMATTLTIAGPDMAGGANAAGRINVYSRQFSASEINAYGNALNFAWSYLNADNTIGDDFAGYFILRGGATNSTTIANNTGTKNQTQSGSLFTVSGLQAGDVFGFFVQSLTSKGGAGTFTISNFNSPLVPVPEASSYLTLGFTALLVGGIAWRRREKKTA